MPRDLTHVILADDIRACLPAKTRQCADACESAFHMGAISHDSFLYGSDPKLSTKMHGGFGDDTRGVVLAMLDDIRKEKDPARQAAEKAFVYGFLTHAAVDSVFHPFVYSVSGSQVRENNPDEKHVKLAKTRHRYVETWLDVHFLRQKKRRLNTFKPLKKMIEDHKNREIAADFFCRNYQKAFDIDRDLTRVYKNSMAVQLFIGRVTKNQTMGKMLRRLDDFLDGRLGMAVSGFYQQDRQMPSKLKNFESFKHPVTGQTVHKNLDGLTRDAVRRGADFIAAAEKYVVNGNKQEFLKAVPNVNLDTGVENTKLVDIKRADPLNVEELKGEKLKKFARSGFKTLSCGSRSMQNGRQKTAHPELRRYISEPGQAAQILKRRQARGR